MKIEANEIKTGLAFFQEGKRVEQPKAGNCAVRPIAGGPFVKVNGQEVLAGLRDAIKGCIFLWLSDPVEPKTGKKQES